MQGSDATTEALAVAVAAGAPVLLWGGSGHREDPCQGPGRGVGTALRGGGRLHPRPNRLLRPPRGERRLRDPRPAGVGQEPGRYRNRPALPRRAHHCSSGRPGRPVRVVLERTVGDLPLPAGVARGRRRQPARTRPPTGGTWLPPWPTASATSTGRRAPPPSPPGWPAAGAPDRAHAPCRVGGSAAGRPRAPGRLHRHPARPCSWPCPDNGRGRAGLAQPTLLGLRGPAWAAAGQPRGRRPRDRGRPGGRLASATGPRWSSCPAWSSWTCPDPEAVLAAPARSSSPTGRPRPGRPYRRGRRRGRHPTAERWEAGWEVVGRAARSFPTLPPRQPGSSPAAGPTARTRRPPPVVSLRSCAEAGLLGGARDTMTSLDLVKLSAARLWAAHRFPYFATALFALAPVADTGHRHLRRRPAAGSLYVDPEVVAGWSVSRARRRPGARHSPPAPRPRPTRHRGGVGEDRYAAWNIAADARSTTTSRRRALPLPEGPVTPASPAGPTRTLAESYLALIRRSDRPAVGASRVRQRNPRAGPALGVPTGDGTSRRRPGERRTAAPPDGRPCAAHARQPGQLPGGWRRWAEAHLRRWWTGGGCWPPRSAGASTGPPGAPTSLRPALPTGDLHRRRHSTRHFRPAPELAVVVDTSAPCPAMLCEPPWPRSTGSCTRRPGGAAGCPSSACDTEVGAVSQVTRASTGADRRWRYRHGRRHRRRRPPRPRPQVVVVLTDGWTPWPAGAPGISVVVGLLADPPLDGGGVGREPIGVPSWARTVPPSIVLSSEVGGGNVVEVHGSTSHRLCVTVRRRRHIVTPRSRMRRRGGASRTGRPRLGL